jgi:hypothetical protein
MAKNNWTEPAMPSGYGSSVETRSLDSATMILVEEQA